MCVDDFEVERKLGEGAYSCVYKVRRASDKMDYAMKSIKMGALSAKERDNAVNEIRFLASLNCPEIIGYKEAFYDEKTNVLNIIMEYMPGGDLLNKIKSLKKKNQFLDEKVVWLYILQMTRGLKKLHDMNILHRDFKCANVMLSRDHKNLKLGDLNVSKVAKKGLLYTQTGTPYYASPEVWRDKPYNSKSDVWSLGCVVYELITLNPPFKAQDMEGLFKKILKGQYDPLPAWYSQDLADFLSLCLQVNPKTRLTTAELLENPLVQKRLNIAQELNVKEYVQSELDSQRQELLKTLKIGKNLKALNSILPEPQYENQTAFQEAIQEQGNSNSINNSNKPNASRNSQHESNNNSSSSQQQQQQQQQTTPLNEIPSNRKQQQSPLIPLQQQQPRPLVLERKLSQPSSHRYSNNSSTNNNNSKISPSPYLIHPRKMSQPYIHLPNSASRINSMNNIQSDISLEINEKINNNNNNSSSSSNSNVINNKKNSIHSKIVSYAKPTRSRSIENVIKSSIQSSLLSANNNINNIVNGSSQVKRIPVRQESVPTLPPINQQQSNGQQQQQQQQLSGSRDQLDNNNSNNLFSNYGAAAALKKRNYHKNYEINSNQPLNKHVNSSLNDSPPPSKSRSIVSSGSGTTNSSSLVPPQQLRSRGSDLMLYAGRKAI